MSLLSDLSYAAAVTALREKLEDTTDAIERLAKRLDSEPGNQIAVAMWMMKIEENRKALKETEGF